MRPLGILSAVRRLRQPKRAISSDYAEFSSWATRGIPVNFTPTTARIQLPQLGFLGNMPSFTQKFVNPANERPTDMAC